MIFDSCSCKQQMLVFFWGWCIPAIYIFPTLETFTLGSPHEMWLKCSLCHVHLCFCSIVAAFLFFVWRGSTRHPWSLSHALLRNLRSEINLVAEILRCWHVCVCVNPTRCHAGKNFSNSCSQKAGGGCMVWQSSTNEDTAFPWWYDKGTPLSRTCHFNSSFCSISICRTWRPAKPRTGACDYIWIFRTNSQIVRWAPT